MGPLGGSGLTGSVQAAAPTLRRAWAAAAAGPCSSAVLERPASPPFPADRRALWRGPEPIWRVIGGGPGSLAAVLRHNSLDSTATWFWPMPMRIGELNVGLSY